MKPSQHTKRSVALIPALLLAWLVGSVNQTWASWDYGNGRHGTFVLTTNATIEQLYQSVRLVPDPAQYDPSNTNAVPNFQNLIITNGATLTANPWDGSAGGRIVLKVQATLSVAPGSSMSVNGLGYLGGGQGLQGQFATGIQGESYAGSPTPSGSANYGGGGGGVTYDVHSTYRSYSGAGGGGYGESGATISHPFFGVLSVGGEIYGMATLETNYLGSGGGGYPIGPNVNGGNGGGAVLVDAGNAEIGGLVQANGNGGTGGSGGGSGGSIRLRVARATLGTNQITAAGGSGNGAGGGSGGVGRIMIGYAENYTGTTMPAAYVLLDTNSDNVTVITNQPISQTSFSGSNAVFTVGFTALSPLFIQWRFNNTPILGATNYTLALTNLFLSQQGNYSVTISNAVMTAVSSNAFLTVLDSNDFDGDGIPNYWELQYGLNPTNALDAATYPPAENLTNKLTYLQKYIYGLNPLTNDTDGDGLSDYAELFVFGTDPLKPDTEGDGMPDGWEVQHGLNPRFNDAADDLDGDGLSNLTEYNWSLLHTNQLIDPRTKYSTSVSTSDYAVVNGAGTNWFLYDRNNRLIGAEFDRGLALAYVYDGNDNLVRQVSMKHDANTNGLPDVWEFLNGLTNNASAYTDTDGDGWTDYQEWKAGTNPRDPQSAPNLLGNPGTQISSLQLPFTPSNFVVGVGQLDGFGAEEIVIGADGNPGTNVNFLLVLTQGATTWSTQRVDIGPFGITSIAVGQSTNRSSAGIYVGLRGTTNGSGRVMEFTSNGGIWQSNLVALSTNETAFVLGINAHKQIVVSLANSSNGPSLLEAHSNPAGTFAASLLATNWLAEGAGSVGHVFSRTMREAYSQVMTPGQIQVFAAPFEFTANGLLLPANAAQDTADGKWHFWLDQLLPWSGARTFLSQYGSDLVVIKSPEKNGWLFARYPQAGWIGASYETSPPLWIDGSRADQGYQNWYDFNPDNGSARRAIMRWTGLSHSGEWDYIGGASPIPALAQVNTAVLAYSNRWTVNTVQMPTGVVQSIGSKPVVAAFRVGQTNSSSLIYAHVPSRQPGENGSVIHQFELVEWMISGNEVTTSTLFQAAHRLVTDSVRVALTLAEFELDRGKRLFTAEPDGAIWFWSATNASDPLQRHLFTEDYSGKTWHALAGVKMAAGGEGLVGLMVDPTNQSTCKVMFWPPQAVLSSPQSGVVETAPAAAVLPSTNTLGSLALVTVRLWDAEGNASTPFLQYQISGSTNWQTATLNSANIPVAASPGGVNHTLVWNAQVDIGVGVLTNILLRARASDMTLLGDWSAGTPFQVNTAFGSNNLAIGPSRLLPDGRFQLTIMGGVLGQSYILLASTNLVDWIPIGGYIFTNSPVTIFDRDAANFRWRFYRIGPLTLLPAMKLNLPSAQPLGSSGLNLALFSLPGLNYHIDASTDLVHWITITNFVSPNSPFFFSDPAATNYNRRFYRAVIP